MRKVKDKYDAIGKELTETGLIWVACYAVAQYWRMKYRRINGTDCGRCSNEQRRKCKEKDLYRECPKAVKIESLGLRPITGGISRLTYPNPVFHPSQSL